MQLWRFVGLTAVAALGASAQKFDKYTVQVQPIPGAAVQPTASVVLKVHPNGKVTVKGSATNLEPNLDADKGDCNHPNGCGVHIHEGNSCFNSTEQGGHFFNGATDPWAHVGYLSTDATGSAHFNFTLNIGRDDTRNRVVVVHASDGSRVACGIMDVVNNSPDRHFAAATTPIPGSSASAHGLVTVVAGADGLVTVTGTVLLLEPGLSSDGGDCHGPNGCGLHVHEGKGCQDSQTQGGHFFGTPQDPWAHSGYEYTDIFGGTLFDNAITTGRTDVQGRAFVVHNSAGDRIACGLLQPLD